MTIFLRASIVWIATASAAIAPARGEAPVVRDYQAVFQTCGNAAGGRTLAIRAMSVAGEKKLLTVDAQSLTTRLEPASAWVCAPTTDEAQKDTRYLRAIRAAGAQVTPASGASRNAGLTHGAGNGVYVTSDLCPSAKPLDRAFYDLLARRAPRAPIAIAVSGAWIARHAADFDWLRAQARAGALDITWVNHSFRHRYRRGVAETLNYLMLPGSDLDAEIFETEKLLIARGETPSAFFRFPGLVADSALMEKLRARHLIALGSDAWLALTGAARPGAIVLVHCNGNEPLGLRIFERLVGQGKMPTPLRRLEDAP